MAKASKNRWRSTMVPPTSSGFPKVQEDLVEGDDSRSSLGPSIPVPLPVDFDAFSTSTIAVDPYPAQPEDLNKQLFTPDTWTFSAWLGRVIKTNYTDVDPGTNVFQTIQVVRIWNRYGTNNEPLADDVSAFGQATVAGVVTAWPFPTHHDQERKLVAVDDVVTVFASQDGRHYFMRDDAPFVAKVVNEANVIDTRNDPPADADFGDTYIVGGTPTGAWVGHEGELAVWSENDPSVWIFSSISQKEDNAGGAGLLTLNVRRVVLNDDSPATPEDLQDASSVNIEYTGVLVVAPSGVHHGYRAGDLVWVKRRGTFFFVEVARESFMAYVVTLGPDGEADFADNHYWVREFTRTVDYSDNTWTLNTDSDTDRTLDDSNGVPGRWVKALNLSEPSGSHAIVPVVEGTPDGQFVQIYMAADPDDGEPWYAFTFGSVGTSSNPQIMLPVDFENEAAQSDTWDRTNQGAFDGVQLRLQTRTAYNEAAASPIFYAFARVLLWDSIGALASIAIEPRILITETEECGFEFDGGTYP